ncbi:unnamed protein product [Lactuca saligna]|uniref:Uncharacterized protein n=1 Tax=Lactuca saligna TaxID=75948 RepID=A0AA36EKR9_LACSI|nr:unnamed protein product [Lactuca saligna]
MYPLFPTIPSKILTCFVKKSICSHSKNPGRHPTTTIDVSFPTKESTYLARKANPIFFCSLRHRWTTCWVDVKIQGNLKQRAKRKTIYDDYSESDLKLYCMFGEIEVRIEIILEGVLCCYAPPLPLGTVIVCITCSEIREFEYLEKQISNPRGGDEEESWSQLIEGWALTPILNSGVGVNFRDINGWTALY